MSDSIYYTSVASGQNIVALVPRRYRYNNAAKLIVCPHGHDGDGLQFITGGATGEHATALAEAGFVVLGISGGGLTTFGNDSDVTAITNAISWAQSTLSVRSSGKVGFMPWSMGMLSTLNWVKRNKSQTGAVWSWEGLTDLDWAHSTSGYVPAYGSPLPNNATWTSEIDTDYPSYSTSSGGYRVRDEYSSWNGVCPMKVVHASDDTIVPIAQAQAFVAGVNDTQVQLRSPIPTGDHEGVFWNVPTSETVGFFLNMA